MSKHFKLLTEWTPFEYNAETIKEYKNDCESKFLTEKIPTIEEAIRSLDPEDHRDDNVAKFLTVMGLCEELQEKNNE